MKKVLLVAEGVVRDGLRVILTMVAGVEIVSDPAIAEVVLAHRREEVLKALEDTQLPIWQLVYHQADAVNNKRVRTFDMLTEVPRLLSELAQ